MSNTQKLISSVLTYKTVVGVKKASVLYFEVLKSSDFSCIIA